MISTKGRYALRVMIDLAKQKSEVNTPLKDIAEREQISKKYLEIIVKELVKAKLLIGFSGKGGGYRLARKPDEYTVKEILDATESSLAVVACLENGAEKCLRASDCVTLPMWTELNGLIQNYLQQKKLSDLL